MFSSIRRFASIIGAMAIVASAVAHTITHTIDRALNAAVELVSMAFDWAVHQVASAAAHLPKPTAKQPTGTALQRMQMVPATTYAQRKDWRRRPTVEPGWRMCASI